MSEAVEKLLREKIRECFRVARRESILHSKEEYLYDSDVDDVMNIIKEAGYLPVEPVQHSEELVEQVTKKIKEVVGERLHNYAYFKRWDDVPTCDLISNDEIIAKKLAPIIIPLIEREVRAQYEPVQLEVLGDEELKGKIAKKRKTLFPHGHNNCLDCEKYVSQATIAHNEAKEQLYRRKE